MEHNALTSTDRVERMFPEGSPLHSLVTPTFDTLRRQLKELCISAIWIDADLDPSRAGFRPSYDGLLGRGAMYMMPFVCTWMSTGAGSERDGGNVVLFPEGIDSTLVEHARQLGTLGACEYIRTLADIKQVVRTRGLKLYSIDDVGEDFDEHVMIPSDLSIWLNSKDILSEVTAYGPKEVIKDMYDVTVDDYAKVKREGCRVFLKTCNTESAGRGVEFCQTEEEFSLVLSSLKARQAEFNLNRTLVLQPEFLGVNRSFQIFLDPENRDQIPVVALTNQYVEEDGKTYKGSENFPVNAETVGPIGHVILDMVERIWKRAPKAFGFLMVDFFETPEGEIVVYDPGIRPSGNTATAMVRLFGRKLTGKDLFVSNFDLKTGVKGLTFKALSDRLGGLTDAEHLVRNDTFVTVWGWNHIQGTGILIGVAPDQGSYDELVRRVRGTEFAR